MPNPYGQVDLLDGRSTYLPDNIQQMIKDLLRYYMQDPSFEDLTKEERSVIKTEVDLHIIKQWVSSGPQFRPWEFPPAEYDHSKLPPAPAPRMIGPDDKVGTTKSKVTISEEVESIAKTIKESSKDKKLEKKKR